MVYVRVVIFIWDAGGRTDVSDGNRGGIGVYWPKSGEVVPMNDPGFSAPSFHLYLVAGTDTPKAKRSLKRLRQNEAGRAIGDSDNAPSSA